MLFTCIYLSVIIKMFSEKTWWKGKLFLTCSEMNKTKCLGNWPFSESFRSYIYLGTLRFICVFAVFMWVWVKGSSVYLRSNKMPGAWLTCLWWKGFHSSVGIALKDMIKCFTIFFENSSPVKKGVLMEEMW